MYVGRGSPFNIGGRDCRMVVEADLFLETSATWQNIGASKPGISQSG